MARSERWIPAALFALAAAVRVYGAWVTRPLSGYDGPYHAGYLGVIFFEGRLPLPNEGWATFHPPLYYAVSAALWGLLPDALSAHGVLFALRLLNVAASLALGAAVWWAARQVVPERRAAAIFATAVALFLPAEMGASFQIGNEMLGAALSAAGVALLLACLRPDASRAMPLALGLTLGLALLTKFNTASVALAAGLVLLAQDWGRFGASPRALARTATVAAIALAVSGAYFAWVFQLHGTPILMQNDVLTAHMARSGYGPTRELSAYLSLRPDILALPLDLILQAGQGKASPPVWPVTFASLWFDLHSTVLFAPSPTSRLAAWVLFPCGALWTGLAVWGAASLLRDERGSWPRVAGGALACVAALALVAYVGFSWRVATFSALKGSYLSPGLLPFSVLAGVGCDRALGAGREMLRVGVLALGLAYVATSAAIFTAGARAPLPYEPATLYVEHYSDPSIERTYELFVGRNER